MRFESLSDANDAYENLSAEIQTMLAIQTGITTVLVSLIAKHSNYDQFQLHLTSVVEMMENSALGNTLTAKQRATARAYVEDLQQIHAATGRIAPIG